MPKVLVLFQSLHPEVATLVDAARDGIRRVRFAEVDVRRLAPANAHASDPADQAPSRSYRTLEHADEIGAYDGMVVVLSADRSGDDPLLAALGASGSMLRDKVGSALSVATGAARTEGLWAALGVMADREMILVPAPFGQASDLAESARRIGQRVAESVGWVTHARSHHHHDQPRDHHHRHDHGHHHP